MGINQEELGPSLHRLKPVADPGRLKPAGVDRHGHRKRNLKTYASGECQLRNHS